MGKKRYLLIAGLSTVLLAIALWFALSSHDSGPLYQGRPLGYWLRAYTPPNNGAPPAITFAQANEAVLQIGTNAIPTLVAMLRATDSKLTIKLNDLVQKQHFFNISINTAQKQNLQALIAFTALGPKAAGAVPALSELYREGRTGQFNNKVIISQILASIGPAAKDANPVLISDATNSNIIIRAGAVWTLGQIHSDPATVVPVLIQALRDPAANVSGTAANGLVAFGPDARSAVPELLIAATNRDPFIRDSAISALKRIDPSAIAGAKIK